MRENYKRENYEEEGYERDYKGENYEGENYERENYEYYEVGRLQGKELYGRGATREGSYEGRKRTTGERK